MGGPAFTVKVAGLPSQPPLPEAETFTERLVCDRPAIATYAGILPLVFVKSPAAGKNGVAKAYRIPAGTAPSVQFSPALNQRGDVFDPALDYLLYIAQDNGVVTVTTRSSAAPDVTPPTVVKAAVPLGSTTTIAVDFSEPVYAPDVLDVTLAFSVGVARVITAVVGNGTTRLLYTLSGAVAPTDVFTISFGAANTVQDLAGNKLATIANHVVGNDATDFTTIPGCAFSFWSPDATKTTLVAGPKVSAWGDKATAPHDLVQATDLRRPAYTAANAQINNQPSLDFAGGQILDMAANLDLSTTQAVEIFLVMKSTHAAVIPLEFGPNVNGGTNGFNLVQADGTNIYARLMGNVGFEQRQTAILDVTAWCVVNARFDKSQPGGYETDLWIGPTQAEGAQGASDNTDSFMSEKLHVGARVGAVTPMTGSYAAVIGFSRILNASERAAVYSVLHNTFGLATP